MTAAELVELEVLEPPGEGDTVELIHALTWARFRHSVSLETLLDKTRQEIGLTEEQVRKVLQGRWRRVASLAREGKFEVWGKPIVDQRIDGSRGWRGDNERLLNAEQLRNCRFLSWPMDPRASRLMPRVERYPNTFSGSFKRDTKQQPDELDFVRISVTRLGLLQEFQRPSPAVAKRRASIATVRRVANELIAALATMDRRLVRKADVLTPLVQEHGLTVRHGGQADQVWGLATQRFPELRTSGPRPSSPTANSTRKIPPSPI